MHNNIIFLDADVLFSAAYSTAGAAHTILQNHKLNFYTSAKCIEEASTALKVKYKKDFPLELMNYIQVIPPVLNEILLYDYVYDPFDAHVVTSAYFCKAHFLITYNLKDYKHSTIFNNLNMTVWSPGQLLFYARNVL